jgi:1,4-dihydroxy-2-naphthoyl-CoA hydrolase
MEVKEIRMNRLSVPGNVQEWNLYGKEFLPGHLGIEILSVEPDEVRARMTVQKNLCAPNGFLHAAAIVALADTSCGYATINTLPAGANGFTTIELKANFLGTALEGSVSCIAKPVHRGRATQVWDAEVREDTSGKIIGLFRCTQMILRPKDSDTGRI